MTEIETYRGGGAVMATTPGVTTGVVSLVTWAQEAQAAYSLAETIVETAFCPQQYRKRPYEAAAAMLAGAELGFNPMASLRCFDNIQGTTAPKAITQVAVAQSHGHVVQVVSESDTKVVVRGKRKGEDWQELTWTIEDAQRLGLTGKSNWKQQPRNMLVARGQSAMARRVAADALLGIPYSSEELQDGFGLSPVTASPAVTASPVTREELLGAVQPPPAAEGPPPITAAQLSALNAALAANGITTADLALALYEDVTGRQVPATRELTETEADAVLAVLAGKGGEPADPPPVDPNASVGWGTEPGA